MRCRRARASARLHARVLNSGKSRDYSFQGTQVLKGFLHSADQGDVRDINFAACIPPHFRELKGFGSETRRFGGDETEVPGPGAYVATASSRDVQKGESMSKKGYGPLTSKAGRFRQRPHYTGPGPGAYNAARVREAIQIKLSPHNPQPTACFHPKVGTVRQVPSPRQ
jgi:hypothetical protein